MTLGAGRGMWGAGGAFAAPTGVSGVLAPRILRRTPRTAIAG